MPGGVEIDVSAALARTIEDINKASDENLVVLLDWVMHAVLLLCSADVLVWGRGTHHSSVMVETIESYV